MKIYESHPGMYNFRQLPAFAQFLLDQHLQDFVQDQLAFSKQVNLPLLKYLSNYSEEQQTQILVQSSREYLGYLAENKAREQIIQSLQRWLANDLKIIGKAEISAQDVTVINYMRSKTFKKWVKHYSVSDDDKSELQDEIDSLFFGAVTSGTDTLIHILKDTIAQELHFNSQLINTSPGVIFIFDLEKQKEVYVNGNVENVMGFTPDEVLAMGDNLLGSLTHPDDLKQLAESIKSIGEDTFGKTYVVEYRFKNKQGDYRWLRTYHTVFKRNAAGKATELLGTTFEVTREKEIAIELSNSEAQLLEAQEIAHIGSFDWDLVNEWSVNTPELDKILELDANSVQQNFMNHVHPDDKPKVQDAMARAFVTGKYDCQYRYQVSGGEKVLWARGVVKFREDRPVNLRGTVQDITQLKKIEAELLKKTRELERSNESLQQFASVASHDLREPLRKMSMYSDMVLMNENTNISELSAINLNKVKSSAIRMQQMIEDILKFSSIASEVKKKPVKLAEAIEQAKEILQESIRDSGARITYDDLPEISAIGSQMRQLFQNLIGNAIKFSKSGVNPEIKISHQYMEGTTSPGEHIQKAQRYLVIKIQDNGIGFKQEYADRIFGLFTRLHPQTTYEGSGLGLSICKRIVENHGGIIRAESSQDEGATFIITLPDHGAT